MLIRTTARVAMEMVASPPGKKQEKGRAVYGANKCRRPPLQRLRHRSTTHDGIESGVKLDNDGERDKEFGKDNSARSDGDGCLATWQMGRGRAVYGAKTPTPPLQGLSDNCVGI